MAIIDKIYDAVDGFGMITSAEASGLPVEQDIDRAVEWANALIGRIEEAARRREAARI